MSIKGRRPLSQVKKENPDLEYVIEIFKLAIELISENPNLMKVSNSQKKKEDLGNVEYELPAAMVMRNYLMDREFPLDTVELKAQELEHDEEIGTVKLHTGAYADEFARSVHALAFTIGSSIYFRNGAYKPETEEGRALLAHELKHVSQNKEYMTADNRTQVELEAEAGNEESIERYNPDPYENIKAGGKNYKIRKSMKAKLNCMVETELENWVESQERVLSKEEYLKLLLKYKKYLVERK
jgi:hypothetical protein